MREQAGELLVPPEQGDTHPSPPLIWISSSFTVASRILEKQQQPECPSVLVSEKGLLPPPPSLVSIQHSSGAGRSAAETWRAAKEMKENQKKQIMLLFSKKKKLHIQTHHTYAHILLQEVMYLIPVRVCSFNSLVCKTKTSI